MSQRADILMGFLHSGGKWAAGCLVREKQSKHTQKHRPEEHGLTPWECTHTELLPRQTSKCGDTIWMRSDAALTGGDRRILRGPGSQAQGPLNFC